MRSFCCYGVVKGFIPRELELHEAVWLIELNVAWWAATWGILVLRGLCSAVVEGAAMPP